MKPNRRTRRRNHRIRKSRKTQRLYSRRYLTRRRVRGGNGDTLDMVTKPVDSLSADEIIRRGVYSGYLFPEDAKFNRPIREDDIVNIRTFHRQPDSDTEMNETVIDDGIKHALVLCQRKRGYDSNTRDVSTHIVPAIESYIKMVLGTDNVSIEYLTPGLKGDTDYDADHKIVLTSATHEGREFIHTHRRYYDLVVMNTCPLGSMDWESVSTILKTRGYLAIKSFHSSNMAGNTSTHFLDNEPHIRMKTREKLLEWFAFARHPIETVDSLFFSKR